MILVDTNIIIDFWDEPSEEAKKVFEENEIATCGVIKTELLRGSNSDKQFLQIAEALNDFSYLSFSENDWFGLSKPFITFKQNGLAVPFQDAMIAYIAIKYDCKVWTNDKHFKLMQVVLPELKLFNFEKDEK